MEKKQKIGLSVGIGIASVLSFVGFYKYYLHLKVKRQLQAEKEDLEVSSIYSKRNNKTGFRVISSHENAGRGVREKGRFRIAG